VTADGWFPRRHRNNRRLLRETLTAMVVVSTLIILLVLAASLTLVSVFLNNDLVRRSVTTADEMAALLADPLYNVDENQAVRFAEVVLTSGRISGIRLESAASGVLLIQDYPGQPSKVPPLSRHIMSNGIDVGTVNLWFDDSEVVRAQTLLFSLALVLVAAVIGASFAAHRFIIRPQVERPFASIGSGIAAITRGRYDRPVPETPYRDVNHFVHLINRMAGKIAAHSEELRQANAQLERNVLERTAELEASLRDLRRTQGRLVESERLSAVGQLAAGMAHQFNTPLGAIISANRTVLEFHTESFPSLLATVFGWTDEQRSRLMELVAYEQAATANDPPRLERREVRALTQRLKARGVKEPDAVGDLLAELRLGSLTEDKPELALRPDLTALLEALYQHAAARDMAQVVALAGGKAANVLSALGDYLSPQSAGQTGEVEVERDLESVLTLVKSQIGRTVAVERRYSGVLAWGSSAGLSQVWMNLINNALQAMNQAGTLRLETVRAKDRVLVRIIDSGDGIPETNLERIFDPFFTTKVKGEGLGLGLDICRKIVESCGGTITVESRPGRTCFTVDLPGAASPT
jgi:signal transduction histidine kinase